MWTNLDRAKIAAGLKVRIDDPHKINQASTSLCGPADFACYVAEDKPVEYAKAVIDYQGENDDAAAITMPHSKEKWLKSAGYTEVINQTNIVFCKNLAGAARASNYFILGYKVALFINADMLEANSMNTPSFFPNHWVALTSAIDIKSINLARPGTLVEDKSSSIKFEEYTWGGRQQVPESGTLTDYNFLSNYYGFIACKR
jgi:hypothetical protein